MPYKSRKIKIENTKYDARIKISPEKRASILAEKGLLSERKTAKKYEVSRKSVSFIWYPEKYEREKALYKIRRLDQRYYIKEKHTEQVRKHRRRKQSLLINGEIKYETLRVEKAKGIQDIFQKITKRLMEGKMKRLDSQYLKQNIEAYIGRYGDEEFYKLLSKINTKQR